AAIALIGAWRHWAWAMPLASAVGFLVAYGCLSLPKLPPVNGNDWLFWMAIPLGVSAVIVSRDDRSWPWALGAVAGVVTFMLLRPLPDMPRATMWMMSLALAVAGALL